MLAITLLASSCASLDRTAGHIPQISLMQLHSAHAQGARTSAHRKKAEHTAALLFWAARSHGRGMQPHSQERRRAEADKHALQYCAVGHRVGRRGRTDRCMHCTVQLFKGDNWAVGGVCIAALRAATSSPTPCVPGSLTLSPTAASACSMRHGNGGHSATGSAGGTTAVLRGCGAAASSTAGHTSAIL